MRVGEAVPISYHGGEGIKRTAGKEFQEGFGAQMADAVHAGKAGPGLILHGTEDASGERAVCSWADAVSGLSTTVYQPQDFDPANPVYRVKTWDSEGNVTERMVDISKVDPGRSDTAEMFAYAAHLQASGKFEGALLKFMSAKAQSRTGQKGFGPESYGEKVNWVDVVREITQSQYDIGNLKGYLEWKMFLNILEG